MPIMTTSIRQAVIYLLAISKSRPSRRPHAMGIATIRRSREVWRRSSSLISLTRPIGVHKAFRTLHTEAPGQTALTTDHHAEAVTHLSHANWLSKRLRDRVLTWSIYNLPQRLFYALGKSNSSRVTHTMLYSGRKPKLENNVRWCVSG